MNHNHNQKSGGITTQWNSNSGNSYLGKLWYFTNLGFPEIRGFPLLNHHLGCGWGRYNLTRFLCAKFDGTSGRSLDLIQHANSSALERDLTDVWKQVVIPSLWVSSPRISGGRNSDFVLIYSFRWQIWEGSFESCFHQPNFKVCGEYRKGTCLLLELENGNKYINKKHNTTRCFQVTFRDIDWVLIYLIYTLAYNKDRIAE